MSALVAILAAHPLQSEPYNAIKFTRIDGCGTPLYRVGEKPKEMGAVAALRAAFREHGGHCFHCRAWMSPQAPSKVCTLDHLRPRHDGGGEYLFNLVLACLACNRKKGGDDLIGFNVEAGAEYMKALDEHLARCVKALAKTTAPSLPAAGPG